MNLDNPCSAPESAVAAARINFLLVVIRLSRLQKRHYGTAEAILPPPTIDMARLPSATIH